MWEYGERELETLGEFAEINKDKFNNFFDYATEITTTLNITVEDLAEMFLELYKYRYIIIDFEQDTNYNAYYKRAKIVYNLNKNKYIKLIATETAEYNPIENYSMTESETGKRTPDLSRSSEGTASQRGTNSATNNTSASSTDSNTSFDSSTFVNNSKNETTDNSTASGENSAESTSTVNIRESGTEQTEREMTRKGNIGVTTTQQMLEQERAVADFSTVKVFFEDVAKMLFFDILNL